MVEQTSLFNVLQIKLARTTQKRQLEQNRGELFWQGVLNFRAVIQQQELVFTDDDFANLRDPSPGREIEL